MGDDPAPLLSAVWANPDDDAPRRALAGWLETRGSPLGGFIRLQLDRYAAEWRTARPRPRPTREEIASRPAAEQAWRALVPELAGSSRRVPRFGLVRGAPGALRLRWSELAESALHPLPIEHLDVVGEVGTGDLARLVALPWVPRLRSLALAGVGLDDAGLVHLLQADWRALRWLDLSANRIADPEPMVASARLPRLAVADLTGNPADPCEHGLDAREYGEADPRGDDLVETLWEPWAEQLWRRHGEPPWQRVLWRRKRERPHRRAMWETLSSTDVAGMDLGGAVVWRGRLHGLRAAGSTWKGATLAASDVHDADFTGAALDGACFARATVAHCRFVRVGSRDLDFAGARVVGTDFTGARLAEARFEDAVVADCVFRDAWLGCDDGIRDLSRTRRARFVRCDFRGAALGGRELVGTTFRDCRFDGVPPTTEGGASGPRGR